jgi:hypothetical protein
VLIRLIVFGSDEAQRNGEIIPGTRDPGPAKSPVRPRETVERG